MPVFLWEGTTKKDEVKKGEMEAADELAVRDDFKAAGV